MQLKFDYFRSHAGGRLYDEADGEKTIDGIISDSRSAGRGKLFLALRGENVNGNAFAPSAVSLGSVAMVDDDSYFGPGCLLVDDVRSALRRAAEYRRFNDLSGVTVIGVTGSVGKTTTKDMVACALASEKTVHKTPGNANSQIGLPVTVLETPADAEIAVLELGMSYRGEMSRISRVAAPDMSIITNIGHSHIENLGSREAIRDEKMKIAEFSPDGSYMLLNGDEPLLRSVGSSGKRIVYVSARDEKCDCFASEVNATDSGVSFEANVMGEKVRVDLGVIGAHYVLNALFALAAAKLTGVSLKNAAKALAEYKSDGKRQFIYEKDGHTVISDCYNAAPESVSAALSVLAQRPGRRVAVLGDMLELGEKAAEYHAELGKTVNASADVLVTYGALAVNYAHGFEKEVYSFSSGEPEKLKDFLGGFIRPGDSVLYKASNGIKLFDCIV